MRSERELILEISQIGHESKSVEEALKAAQSLLAREVGGSTLLLESRHTGHFVVGCEICFWVPGLPRIPVQGHLYGAADDGEREGWQIDRVFRFFRITGRVFAAPHRAYRPTIWTIARPNALRNEFTGRGCVMSGAKKGRATLSRLLRSLATSVPLWPHETTFGSQEEPAFKVLLVVAHPDDESECAAVLYRITHELGGAVDQVVVTNGEAGTQYSAPAQAYYGTLGEETSGRKRLARLRRKEVIRAGKILGIRNDTNSSSTRGIRVLLSTRSKGSMLGTWSWFNRNSLSY